MCESHVHPRHSTAGELVDERVRESNYDQQSGAELGFAGGELRQAVELLEVLVVISSIGNAY